MIIGMDIITQTKGLIYETLTNGTCEGMSVNEYNAYVMGIKNTISALRAMLETEEDCEYVIHIPGKKDIEEYDAEDMEDYDI